MRYKIPKSANCRGKKIKVFYDVQANLPNGVSKVNSIFSTKLLSSAKINATKIYSNGLKNPKRMPTSVEITKITVYENKCAYKDLDSITYNLYKGMLRLSEKEKIYVYNKQYPKGKRIKS